MSDSAIENFLKRVNKDFIKYGIHEIIRYTPPKRHTNHKFNCKCGKREFYSSVYSTGIFEPSTLCKTCFVEWLKTNDTPNFINRRYLIIPRINTLNYIAKHIYKVKCNGL